VLAFVHVGEITAVGVCVRAALAVLILLPVAAHLIFLIRCHFKKLYG